MTVEQNEIKKIITVDLGNTTTSLKDYKKHIDELRGSLLQLDETSEEYQTIAKEIKAEQDKLNEVMQVGKKTTDAAEGSYNQLSQTMSELKKQWKATADEAERADLGKQILDINNQLKELDASTGNFQRNVGDYTNAFEKAFDKCLDGIKSIDGPIGELGGNIKNMLPVIKNINSTAIKGLTGIKKAIAATGIGLLVIAVSTLIQHWETFTKVIGVSEQEISNFKEKALNTFESIIAGAVGVGNVIGNFIIAPTKTAIEAFRGLGNVIRDVFTGNWDNIKTDAKNALDAIKSVTQKAVDFKGNYQTGVDIANNMISGIKERFVSNDVQTTVEESGKNIGKTIGKSISEDIEEEFEENTIDSKTQSILDRLHKRNTDELELLREKYEEEKSLLEQYGLDTTQLQQEFEEEAEKIIDKRLDAEQKAIEEQEKAEEELTAKKIAEEQKAAKAKQQAQQSLISSTATMLGAISEMFEEGSEEQKAFSIMETIINTLQAIMGTWAGYAEMGPWGVAAAAVQTAAIAATGAATIAKMKSTTKESANSASVAAPNVQAPSMTSVFPLLDETNDLNRLETSGLQGNSQNQTQNMRVYVVEQDIRDAGHKAEVVEDNATF